MKKTGCFITGDGIRLQYEELGSGNRIIISGMAGVFYPKGLQQAMADRGYHVYCLTLRGFSPSDYVDKDYGNTWYDIFAQDIAALADHLEIQRFFYLGASHGAGVGWHLLWRYPDRVSAFVAVVPGPHSLETGSMSYRQMLMQGLISAPPPFDPPAKSQIIAERRRVREKWLHLLPETDPREKKIEYGRPMMGCVTEAELQKVLSSFRTPVLILGGTDDPISTPELMTRTAKCLPDCKMVLFSGFGHNIDSDIPDELASETVRFLSLY